MSKKIICIDAGHGGYDSGAVNKSRYEKNDNLKITTLLMGILKTQGFEVVLPRTEDKETSLQKRVEIANKANADVFISLHRNAFTNSSACGVENWIYQNTDEKSKQLAQYILNEITSVGVQKNRGVKSGNFYVLRTTKMPACLLELGFISNLQDNIVFDTNIENYAVAIAKGICNYFKMPYTKKAHDQYYRVQVGAFESKEKAENLAQELKSKGYPPTIILT